MIRDDIILRYNELARKDEPENIGSEEFNKESILSKIAEEYNKDISFIRNVIINYERQNLDYRLASDNMPAWEDWIEMNDRHIKELETLLADWTQEKMCASEGPDYIYAKDAQAQINMLMKYISYIKKFSFEESH